MVPTSGEGQGQGRSEPDRAGPKAQRAKADRGGALHRVVLRRTALGKEHKEFQESGIGAQCLLGVYLLSVYLLSVDMLTAKPTRRPVFFFLGRMPFAQLEPRSLRPACSWYVTARS